MAWAAAALYAQIKTIRRHNTIIEHVARAVNELILLADICISVHHMHQHRRDFGTITSLLSYRVCRHSIEEIAPGSHEYSEDSS